MNATPPCCAWLTALANDACAPIGCRFVTVHCDRALSTLPSNAKAIVIFEVSIREALRRVMRRPFRVFCEPFQLHEPQPLMTASISSTSTILALAPVLTTLAAQGADPPGHGPQAVITASKSSTFTAKSLLV